MQFLKKGYLILSDFGIPMWIISQFAWNVRNLFLCYSVGYNHRNEMYVRKKDHDLFTLSMRGYPPSLIAVEGIPFLKENI